MSTTTPTGIIAQQAQTQAQVAAKLIKQNAQNAQAIANVVEQSSQNLQSIAQSQSALAPGVGGNVDRSV
jgi:two-component sensor histidine kinase